MVADHLAPTILRRLYVVCVCISQLSPYHAAYGDLSCMLDDDEQSVSGSLLQAMSYRIPSGSISATHLIQPVRSTNQTVNVSALHTSSEPHLTPLLQKAKEWVAERRLQRKMAQREHDLEKELDEQKRLLERDLFGSTADPSQKDAQNTSNASKRKSEGPELLDVSDEGRKQELFSEQNPDAASSPRTAPPLAQDVAQDMAHEAPSHKMMTRVAHVCAAAGVFWLGGWIWFCCLAAKNGHLKEYTGYG
eukprot:gnl/MRDRNA2_/MRDRNA2_61174_c0_seq1.p1 gnl/MRDRNA2_/MRDRNA2_61174_c0~~gnl/MRDRNA2_/MRDRNA2_61174_c0_seq1.p1  ORF type:complete len:248 (+),score=47.48 gnl/MRDRNA2_/MRDRNA2_61174_c0_seq1:154-897(+)